MFDDVRVDETYGLPDPGMHILDEQQFLATFGYPMQQVGPDPDAVRELPTAVQMIPTPHLQGFALDGLFVEIVRRAETGIFEHYLVRTTTPNVFLVLVWDRTAGRFYGYHLLDLNSKYGLPTPPARGPE